MYATIFQMIPTTTKTSLMRLQKDTISIQFWCRLVQILHCSRRMVDLVVVELAHWDGVLCYLCQTLHIIALWFWWLRRAVRTWTVEHKHPNIFTSEALWRCSEKGVIFGRNRIVACAVFFLPSDVGLWFTTTRAIQKSVQYGFVPLFHCIFGWDVSCVINSLPLCVSVTCTVRWAFLYHVVWNRQNIKAIFV